MVRTMYHSHIVTKTMGLALASLAYRWPMAKKGKRIFGQEFAKQMKWALNQICKGRGDTYPSSWVQIPVIDAWKSAKAFQTLPPVSWLCMGPSSGSDGCTQKHIIWGTGKMS